MVNLRREEQRKNRVSGMLKKRIEKWKELGNMREIIEKVKKMKKERKELFSNYLRSTVEISTGAVEQLHRTPGKYCVGTSERLKILE